MRALFAFVTFGLSLALISGCAINSGVKPAGEETLKSTKISFRAVVKDQQIVKLSEIWGARTTGIATVNPEAICRKVGQECDIVEYCCGAHQCENTCVRRTCTPIYECEPPMPDCKPHQPC